MYFSSDTVARSFARPSKMLSLLRKRFFLPVLVATLVFLNTVVILDLFGACLAFIHVLLTHHSSVPVCCACILRYHSLHRFMSIASYCKSSFPCCQTYSCVVVLFLCYGLIPVSQSRSHLMASFPCYKLLFQKMDSFPRQGLISIPWSCSCAVDCFPRDGFSPTLPSCLISFPHYINRVVPMFRSHARTIILFLGSQVTLSASLPTIVFTSLQGSCSGRRKRRVSRKSIHWTMRTSC